MLLTIMSTLTAAAVSAGLYMMREVSFSDKDVRAFYDAESAINHVVFYLKQDTAAHTERQLGTHDYNRRFKDMRYMADGIDRTLILRGKTLPYRISDAVGGFSLTPFTDLADRLRELREKRLKHKIVSFDEERAFDRFMGNLEDYLDSDDNRNREGRERDDYVQDGFASLPRNGAPEFAGELAWIANAGIFFHAGPDGRMQDINVIAPAGLAEIPDKVSLFSSSMETLKNKLELSDSEVEELEKAMNLWRTEQTLLKKSLHTELLNKIYAEESEIETEESGIYRIEIGGGTPSRLTAVLQLNSGTNFLEYYEYCFF